MIFQKETLIAFWLFVCFISPLLGLNCFTFFYLTFQWCLIRRTEVVTYSPEARFNSPLVFVENEQINYSNELKNVLKEEIQFPEAITFIPSTVTFVFELTMRWWIIIIEVINILSARHVHYFYPCWRRLGSKIKYFFLFLGWQRDLK